MFLVDSIRRIFAIGSAYRQTLALKFSTGHQHFKCVLYSNGSVINQDAGCCQRQEPFTQYFADDKILETGTRNNFPISTRDGATPRGAGILGLLFADIPSPNARLPFPPSRFPLSHEFPEVVRPWRDGRGRH